MVLTDGQVIQVADQLGWKYYWELDWPSPQYDIPPKAIRTGLCEPYSWVLTNEGIEEIATKDVKIYI